MQLELVIKGDAVMQAKTVGQITQSSLPDGRDLFQELLGADAFRRTVLVSLAESDYLDSSGVGWLLRNHKQFEKAGGKLVLHSVPPTVMQVLKVLRLPMVLHVAKDLAEARAMAPEEAA